MNYASDFYSSALSNNNANWVLFGKIADENSTMAKVVAVGINGKKYSSKINNNKFSITLPADLTYSIHFINLNNDINTLTFEDSQDIGLKNILRLGKITESKSLNLGEMDFVNGNAYASLNPAYTLNFDNDNLPDCLDPDDQNDNLADSIQQQELESVEICHKEKLKNNKIIKRQVYISLSDFYLHSLHGDYVGSCANNN